MRRAVSGRTSRSHRGLRSSIEECIGLLDDPRACDARAPSVSGWSVANHLEHLLLADRWIIGWIESSVPGESDLGGEAAGSSGEVSDESADHGGKPSALGHVVLSTGFIPRGRGRAPEPSRPNDLSAPEIMAGFREVRDQVDALGPLLGQVDASSRTRQHPVLGHFTPARWLRFAAVHHVHHDKIVHDILAAAAD